MRMRGTGIPGRARVDGLEVIRAEEENHERQRRVRFDALLEADAAVASRLEGIVPRRASAVQAVLEDAH
jgi:hypothetical protein